MTVDLFIPSQKIAFLHFGESHYQDISEGGKVSHEERRQRDEAMQKTAQAQVAPSVSALPKPELAHALFLSIESLQSLDSVYLLSF